MKRSKPRISKVDWKSGDGGRREVCSSSLRALYWKNFLFFQIVQSLFSSVQFNSLAQWCPTLCNPLDCSTQGFPVYHQLLGLAQIHVHRVGHAPIISFVALFTFCPQSFLASESFPMSQLFTSGDQSIGASASESGLPMNIQG